MWYNVELQGYQVTNVLLIFNSTRLETASFIRGVSAFAEKLKWNVRPFGDSPSIEQIGAFLAKFRPAGCIVQCAGKDYPPESLFGDTPVVFIDRSPTVASPESLLVVHDFRRDGEFAAKELLSLGCASYVFLDVAESPFWSRERRNAFASALAAADVAEPAYFKGGESDLAAMLSALPKPVGIFAANDATAEPVFAVCRDLGLSIPEDVAVIGVDDDDIICGTTSPALTTVQPNWETAGWLAASLLKRKLSEPDLRGVRLIYEPGPLRRRGSTMRHRRLDDRVSAAIASLRQASGNMTLEELVALIGGSRRNAEMKFKKATGHTILEGINDLRIDCAREMLASFDCRIGEVARRCGFKSEATFRRVFQKMVGCSARDWQKLGKTGER